MGWFAYALLATFLMTCINFGDKFVVESQVPNPLALLIFLAWFNLIIGIILWIIVGFSTIPLSRGLLLIGAGTAPAFGGFFYFQAVSKTETTRIVILSQLLPLFTLIISVLFLQETITNIQFVGFTLIMIAAIAVTVQRSKSKGDINVPLGPLWDVLGLMLMTNLIYASALVLTDSLVESLVTDIHSLTVVTAYTSFGYWIGGMTLFVLVPPVRHSFTRLLSSTGLKAIASLSGVESIFVIRQFVVFTALTLGPVSLVSVIGSLNVFFAIIFGWILTLWQPHIFKEDISRTNLIRKFAWAAVAFIGIILLR